MKWSTNNLKKLTQTKVHMCTIYNTFKAITSYFLESDELKKKREKKTTSEGTSICMMIHFIQLSLLSLSGCQEPTVAGLRCLHCLIVSSS